MKKLAIIVAALTLATYSVSPSSGFAVRAEPSTTGEVAAASVEEQAYAAREAASPELQDFVGGWHVVVFIVLVAAALIVVLAVLDLFSHHCSSSCPYHRHPVGRLDTRPIDGA